MKSRNKSIEFDTNDLNTVEDCDLVQLELEALASTIKSQIAHSEIDVREERGDSWRANARAALRFIYIDLTWVLRKRGYLLRCERRANALRLNEQNVEIARLKNERILASQLSYDRKLIEFIKESEPEAFARAVKKMKQNNENN